MMDIRWLEIYPGTPELSKHPSALRIDSQQYVVYRVLQVRFEVFDDWCDIPIVNMAQTNDVG